MLYFPKLNGASFRGYIRSYPFPGHEKVKSNYVQQILASTLHPRKAYLKAITFCNNAEKREAVINTLNL